MHRRMGCYSPCRRKECPALSRLDIKTPSRAQTVVEGLYRDVERRIADLKKLLAAYRGGLVRTPSRME